MEKITFAKKFWVFIKHNGRIVIGGILVALVIFVAIFAPMLTKWDPLETDVYNAYQAPSSEHIMGTDRTGTDLWAQVAYGSRASLIIATASQLLSMAIGALLGLICGFYPKVDMVIMRILEAINSLPTILLVFVLSMAFGAGYANMILAMTIIGIPGTTRYIRSQVMSLRQKEFVEREIAMGAGAFRIMVLHVLPQCMSYILVSFGSGLSGKIMSLTTLCYLGVGLPASVPDWGGLIGGGQQVMMIYPFVAFYPMLALAITGFGFSMLGDGLRDLLDPTTN